MYALSLHIDDVAKNMHNISFLNTVKNEVLEGLFTKVMYSHNNYTLNRIIFNLSTHSNMIEKLKQIENDILHLYCNYRSTKKKSIMSLSNCLNGDKMKCYEDDIAIKISGVWETTTHIGLTFKINNCKVIT